MVSMLTIDLTHDVCRAEYRCYAGFAIRFSCAVERSRLYDPRGPGAGSEHRREYQRVHRGEVRFARAATDATARTIDGGVPDPSGWTEIPFQYPVLPGRARAQPRFSGCLGAGILERK